MIILFAESEKKQHINILPHTGEVYYYGCVLNSSEAQFYFDKLLSSILWKPDEAIIYGKHITTKRKVAWYADYPYEYTYSKITRRALPWPDELVQLKKLVEKTSKETFNSCLMNLYHNGSEGMAWHSDGEKELKKNAAIASLSLGATRKFSFKNKNSKETVSLMLPTGSLLVMKGETQTHWLHSLPPTKKIKMPRINLTFRTIG